MTGLVYLIGAGPGDAKLITLKGRECIEKADVVVYDYLADSQLLTYAKDDAELIYVGKKNRSHHMEQDQINQILIDKAKEGKLVARLKGGDPLVFGRGGEEALSLRQAGIPFEFVPGVTSAISVPAYAGIPVTQRAMASSFAVVTGHEMAHKDTIHWEGLATAVDTLTFVMGVTNVETIATKLMAHGRDPRTPVALIRWGTKACQETLVATLETMVETVRKAHLKPPALIVIGDVVSMRDQLQWFDNKPLFGKTIVTTRAKGKAADFADALRDRGAQVIEAAAIRTQALALTKEDQNYLDRLGTYDYLTFTSAEGVKYFFKALWGRHEDSRAIGNCKVCAVGTATAKALMDYGIIADLIPANYKAESVATALASELPKGAKVLLVQPKVARSVIQDSLYEEGILVDTIRLYETLLDQSQKEALLAAFEEGVDYITFTSGSTVKNTLKLLGTAGRDVLAKTKIACIGPITAAAVVEAQLKPALISEVYTMDGLLESILDDVK